MNVRCIIGLVLLVWLLGVACSVSLPQPKRCNTDTQCDSLPGEKEIYQCVSGYCQAIKICASNADCLSNIEECILARCKRTEPCTEDAQCKPGMRCLSERCQRVQVTEDLLVLYLKFEKGADETRVSDSSTHEHHGQWRGGGKFTSEGYIGMAGDFAGEKVQVAIPNHEHFQPRQMTLSAWVYRKASDKGGSIIHYFDDNLRNGYGLEINGSGKASFLVADASARHSCAGNTTIPVGQWTHIGGSFDGNLLRCFVNGRIDGTEIWSGNPSYETTREMIIGGASVEGDVFQGRIDEVKIYPLAQRQQFSPELARYLYVANADATKILAINTDTDALDEGQSFTSPRPGSWPVALSDSGKFLYLWDSGKQQILMVDVSAKTKKLLAAADAPGGGGWSDGILASYLSDHNAVWLWGKNLHVFPAFFAEQAKPLASFNGLGETFAADVALLQKQQQFVATDTDKQQLLFFDLKERKQAATLDLKDTKIPGKQPLAIASLPEGQNLLVSFADSSELKKFQYDATKGAFQETGAFTTKETVPDANGKDVIKNRKIKRLINLPDIAYLYYTFTETRLIYYQDVVPGLQYRLSEWLDRAASPPTARKLDPLTSSYYPHLHYLGHKLYFQDDNTGRFVAIDVVAHQIIKVFDLGSATAKKRLPIVGVRHPSQVY